MDTGFTNKMKKIRHSKLPITLESSDHLNDNMLKAIEIQMTATGWERWIDEYGNWFRVFVWLVFIPAFIFFSWYGVYKLVMWML